jgi:membrane protein DedA with SNARE-associated domain
MGSRTFTAETLANACGTLIAAAVIYLVGVVVGAFTFDLLVTVLSVAAAVLGAFVAYVVAYNIRHPLFDEEWMKVTQTLEEAYEREQRDRERRDRDRSDD